TYNSTHAQLMAWVRVPYLSATVDTNISLYYSNSTMSSRQNQTGVWDDSYKGVWHLQETDIDGGSGDIKDSTSYGNNGNTEGSMDTNDQVPGMIDGSFDLDGTDDIVNVSDDSSLNIRSSLTMEAWVNASVYDNEWNDIMGKEDYNMYVENGKLGAYFETDDRTYDKALGSTTMVVDTWYYVVLTYDAGTIKAYIDGALDGTASKGTIIDDSTGFPSTSSSSKIFVLTLHINSII
ncbi:unnamed protein product, partial [marine sediment metagenome]